MQKLSTLTIIAFLSVSACSTGTDLERAAVGAVGGCLVGDAFDEGSCIRGAVVGAGVGALADDISF